MKALRVLIVDDSAFNRRTLVEIFENHPETEVVGKAFDGEEALKLATQLKPDLITLDVEMPRMDGFTFLRILMSKMPTPVIVISSHSRKEEVFQALELGALDFIAKPDHHLGPGVDALREELIEKTLLVRSLRPLPAFDSSDFAARKRASQEVERKSGLEASRGPQPPDRLLCIGASTGGPPAIESIFHILPPLESTAFLVAQHMPEKFTRAFAERLNRMSGLEISEAEAGMEVFGGRAYIAPGGSHLEIGKSDDGWRLRVSPAAAGDRYVPSVDRLFFSAAKNFDRSLLAMVLTGMGTDGSAGIEAVRAAKGATVAESQESAIVFGMPHAAIETGAVDDVLGLPSIVERARDFALGGTG